MTMDWHRLDGNMIAADEHYDPKRRRTPRCGCGGLFEWVCRNEDCDGNREECEDCVLECEECGEEAE